MFRRSSGSPPVSRIFCTPCSTKIARDARDLLEGQQLGVRQELDSRAPKTSFGMQ